MNITEAEIKKFRVDFHEAMKALEEKYDITITLGDITYNKTEFSGKMMVNNSRDPEQIASDMFDQEVWKYYDIGLREGMYRQIFIARPDGRKYAIMGFNANAKKYPFHVMRLSDGMHFKVPKTFIKEILHAKYIEPEH